jgi:hypothetical protein
MAIGSTWNSCAKATRGFRESGCTFVASITVSRPAAGRLRAMKWRTSNASFVEAWSFSSPYTKPRYLKTSASLARSLNLDIDRLIHSQ